MNYSIYIHYVSVKDLYVDAKCNVQLAVTDLQEWVVENINWHQVLLTESVYDGPGPGHDQGDVMISQVVAVEVHKVQVLLSIDDEAGVDNQTLVAEIRKSGRFFGFVVQTGVEKETQYVSVDSRLLGSVEVLPVRNHESIVLVPDSIPVDGRFIPPHGRQGSEAAVSLLDYLHTLVIQLVQLFHCQICKWDNRTVIKEVM